MSCVTVGIDTTFCQGGLSLGGVNMNCPAWKMLDLSALWYKLEKRGQDIVVPGVSGMLSYPRRATGTSHSLPMVIVGDCDPAGSPFANPWIGLESNINVLRGTVLDAFTTIGAVLTMPSGATRSGPVQIDSFELGDHTFTARYAAVLNLTIPAGVLV